MPYSYVTFTGDGSDTTYSFAGISQMFPNTFLSYLSQLDVYLNGVLQTPTTDWSVTDVTNKIITFVDPPNDGDTIKITRDTKKDALLHSFSSGSIITANDLNNNTRQIFYITQEIADSLGNSVSITPAGDKWDFEGLPTYNGAPAVEASGFTTLAQVTSLLAGATVGIFDEVDSFKFNGDGTTAAFDLTGITKAGLTADALIVQVNGIIQDPDVFTPTHTPAGSIGNGDRTSVYRKIVLPYTLFQASIGGIVGGSPPSDGSDSGMHIDPPVVVGNVSTIRIHQLDEGEVCSDWGIDQVTGFTGGAATFRLTVKEQSGNLEDGSTQIVMADIADPPNTFGNTFGDTGTCMPVLSSGNGELYIRGTFSTAVTSLAAGLVHIWLKIESPNHNAVTSVTVSGSADEANSDKYSLSYVSGVPRVTFNTAPADDSIIIVRVLSGTFQGYIEDGDIGNDQLADDSVSLSKINVGAGVDNRILVFDTLGDPAAEVATAALISDFDAAVRTSRVDQMTLAAADINVNSNKITNLAVGTLSTDAVTKGQLDAVAASTGITIARSSHNIGSVSSATPIPIAYPSGFTTYPKMVFVRLMSASSLAYGAVSGFSTEANAFYTDSGTVDPRALDLTDYSNGGTKATVQIEVTGTTTGISIKRNNTALTWAEVTWIK